MSVIPPTPPRCIIENTSPSLIITIPGRKHWFVIVYTVLLFFVLASVTVPIVGMLLAGAGVSLVSLLGGFGNTQSDSIAGAIGFFGNDDSGRPVCAVPFSVAAHGSGKDRS
jgi:hypothetical protein